MKTYRRVLFDIDGVLADWVAGVLRKYPSPPLAYGDVRWDIEKQLGLDPAAFWASLDYDFWLGLPVSPDGAALYWLMVEKYGVDVGLVSCPAVTSPGCRDAKYEWVKRHLGPFWAKQLFLGCNKHLVAAPGVLLIDDRNENVDDWVKAGGSAALVPRPWNRDIAKSDPATGQFNVSRFVEENHL